MKLTDAQREQRAFESWLLQTAGYTQQTFKFASLQERIKLVAQFNALWEEHLQQVEELKAKGEWK